MTARADRRPGPDLGIMGRKQLLDERLGDHARRAVARLRRPRVIARFVVEVVPEVTLAEVHVLPRVENERVPEIVHSRTRSA